MLILGGCSNLSADKYYKEGRKYVENGNYQVAADNFVKAIEKNPNCAEYYIDYGMALIMLHKNEEAIENFDRAILDKDNMIVNKNNKLAYRGKGIAYIQSFQYKEAIEQFHKALAIDELTSLDVDILYYKGSAEEKAGFYDEAINTYTLLIKKDPSDANAYSSRGYTYGKLKQWDKGLADYDKAISIDNRNYNYYFGKYSLLLDGGQADDANKVLEEAANIPIETEEDKFNLAKVHYFMEEYDLAINEFNSSFQNGFEEAYYYLGNIYAKQDEYEEAVVNYQKFLESSITTKTALVYNQISACLLKLGRYSDALSYIQAGLEYKDVSMLQPLKRNEIIAYEKMGDFVKAYHLMTDYMKEYPDDKEAIKDYEFLKTRLPEVSKVEP